MAELNLVFTVLCQHCGTPLHGRVKFCPSCGKEESISLVAGAATARRALERETRGQAEAQAPMVIPPAAVPRHEVQEVVAPPVQEVAGMSAVPRAARKATGQEASMPARFAPPSLESQAEGPAQPIAMPLAAPMPPRGEVPKRSMIGKVAVVAFVLLVLVPGSIYFNKQNETEKSPQLAEIPAEAPVASDREELTEAQRAIAALAIASYPVDPGVRKSSDEIELESGSTSAQAAPAVEVPATIATLPGLKDTPAPQETTCSQALAALALCPNEPMSGTEAGGR